MADLRFDSTLSIEEIEDNFKDVDVFSGVMDGLQEALTYESCNSVSKDIPSLHRSFNNTK